MDYKLTEKLKKMAKMFENIFLVGICMMVLSSCSSKGEKVKMPDVSLSVENQTGKGFTEKDSVNKDTLNATNVDKPTTTSNTTTDSLDLPPYSTATLVNWKEYFRTNNNYKNWYPKNPKTVVIVGIVEKDGTITDLKIVKKCDVELLNKEALRLIRDAKANGAQIEPARNSNGDYIRSRWTIPVSFPPK